MFAVFAELVAVALDPILWVAAGTLGWFARPFWGAIVGVAIVAIFIEGYVSSLHYTFRLDEFVLGAFLRFVVGTAIASLAFFVRQRREREKQRG